MNSLVYHPTTLADEKDARIMAACEQAVLFYGPHDRNRALAFIGMSEEEVAEALK